MPTSTSLMMPTRVRDCMLPTLLPDSCSSSHSRGVVTCGGGGGGMCAACVTDSHSPIITVLL